MKRPYHHWTTRQLQQLRAVYPTGGVNACLPLFADVSKHAIYAQASLMGLLRTYRKEAA